MPPAREAAGPCRRFDPVLFDASESLSLNAVDAELKRRLLEFDQFEYSVPGLLESTSSRLNFRRHAASGGFLRVVDSPFASSIRTIDS